MKNIFLITLFLISTILYSQKKEFVVTYSIKSNTIVSKNALPKVKFTSKKINEIFDETIFFLSCRNQKTLFAKQDNLDSDSKDLNYKVAMIVSQYDGEIFTDLDNNKKLSYENLGGESFLVENKINNLKWTLLSDEKVMLDKYRCFKATASKKNSDGIDQEITAWYCPELNVSSGPNGYSGLPGLILEVERNKVVYEAKCIEFKPVKEIIIPIKKKSISSDNFQNLEKKFSEKVKKQYSN